MGGKVSQITQAAQAGGAAPASTYPPLNAPPQLPRLPAPQLPQLPAPAQPMPGMASGPGMPNPYMLNGEINPIQPMTGGDPFSQINEQTMIKNAIARMGVPGQGQSYQQLLSQVAPIGPLGQIRPVGSLVNNAPAPQQQRQQNTAQYNAAGSPLFGSFFSMTGAPEDQTWVPYKKGSRAYNRHVQDARAAEDALQGG